MTSGHAKRRLSQIGTSGVFAWYKPNTQNIWNPELWFEPSSTASSSLNSRPYDHRCDHSLNPIGISEFTTSRFLCKCSWSFNLQNPEKVYRMESSSLEPCPRDLVMLPRNIPSSTSDFAIRGNRDAAPTSHPSNSRLLQARWPRSMVQICRWPTVTILSAFAFRNFGEVFPSDFPMPKSSIGVDLWHLSPHIQRSRMISRFRRFRVLALHHPSTPKSRNPDDIQIFTMCPPQWTVMNSFRIL